MTSQERRQLISQGFRRIFGGEPAVWVRAPSRVDLMGSHTDHNMGYVMAMTIDRDAWIAARPRRDRRVTVHSLILDGGIDSKGSVKNNFPHTAGRVPREAPSSGSPSPRSPS